MSGSDGPVQGVNSSSVNARQAALQKMASAKRAQRIEAFQALTAATKVVDMEQMEFNPLAMLKEAETLEKRMKKHLHSDDPNKTEQNEDIAVIEDVTRTAEEFQNKNPEMEKRALLSLKMFIEIDDTPEQILAKVLKAYPDQYLADEALDFLCDTSQASTKVGNNLRRARILLNQQFGREVRAGRNINTEAHEFSKQGMGSAGGLRDLYRDITGNPRDAATLFEELTDVFSFDKMRTVIKFVLHSIGSDLKSKGPSIPRGELQRLFTEARSMQAIMGVFRFFFQRMKLIEAQFHREDLTLPSRVTFDSLAKIFIKLISERYPSPDKVLRLGHLLGLSDELLAQIIIYTQFRDAMRGVAPQLFKSEKHRQDMLMTLIETISELDDLLEEEEEEEEEEEAQPPGWDRKDTIE